MKFTLHHFDSVTGPQCHFLVSAKDKQRSTPLLTRSLAPYTTTNYTVAHLIDLHTFFFLTFFYGCTSYLLCTLTATLALIMVIHNQVIMCS